MLKTYHFLILVVCMMVNTLAAQTDFKIVEQTSSMSKGSYNCLTVELKGSDLKTINKSWSSFIKNYKGKTKLDKKANETFTDNASIKEMSDNTVDIYARPTVQGKNTKMSVWFNLGVTYLSSKDHPERYAAGEKIVMDFAYYVSADLLAIELKAKEKEIKKEKKDLAKIEKTRTKFEKKIEKYKAIIAKAETGIKAQETEIKKNKEAENKQLAVIEETNKEIEDYKRLISEAKARSKRK